MIQKVKGRYNVKVVPYLVYKVVQLKVSIAPAKYSKVNETKSHLCKWN